MLYTLESLRQEKILYALKLLHFLVKIIYWTISLQNNILNTLLHHSYVFKGINQNLLFSKYQRNSQFFIFKANFPFSSKPNWKLLTFWSPKGTCIIHLRVSLSLPHYAALKQQYNFVHLLLLLLLYYAVLETAISLLSFHNPDYAALKQEYNFLLLLLHYAALKQLSLVSWAWLCSIEATIIFPHLSALTCVPPHLPLAPPQ